MKNPLPAVFFGHGNPMNALEVNDYSRGWARFGRDIPRPKAVLSISAHWYVPGTLVSGAAAPRTIHDFGGFPKELYRSRTLFRVLQSSRNASRTSLGRPRSYLIRSGVLITGHGPCSAMSIPRRMCP